jgi:hypothetical protein
MPNLLTQKENSLSFLCVSAAYIFNQIYKLKWPLKTSDFVNKKLILMLQIGVVLFSGIDFHKIASTFKMIL